VSPKVSYEFVVVSRKANGLQGCRTLRCLTQDYKRLSHRRALSDQEARPIVRR
jgi:hypothetical protein